MGIDSIFFWAVVAGLVLYVISIYNHLVRLKHNVSKAWSNIDVLLKQRHDEIPKLIVADLDEMLIAAHRFLRR